MSGDQQLLSTGRSTPGARESGRKAGQLRWTVSYVVLVVAVVAAPLAAAAQALANEGAPAFGARAAEAWQQYVDTVHTAAKQLGTTIQAGCEPMHYDALSHGADAYRGVVLLYHGFSACPQQYWRMAPVLAAQGYDVLLPLNPGHGLAYTHSSSGNSTIDNLALLPDDPTLYHDFEDTLSNVTRLAGGVKVVAGLSLGGGLAQHAALQPADPAATTGVTDRSSTTAAPRNASTAAALYTRQLVMNPLFAVSNPAMDAALRALNAIPVIRDTIVGWGEGCQHERAGGRAGICTFKISQVSAAVDFGRATRSASTGALASANFQMVYDLNDPVVSVADAQDTFAAMAKGAASSAATAMCHLPSAVGHSFLSEFDTPSANKWWLNEATCRLTSYLAAGDVDHGGDLGPHGFLAAGAPDKSGLRACDIVCNATECPYTPHQNVTCPFPRPKLGAGRVSEPARARGAASWDSEALGVARVPLWSSVLQCASYLCSAGAQAPTGLAACLAARCGL